MAEEAVISAVISEKEVKDGIKKVENVVEESAKRMAESFDKAFARINKGIDAIGTKDIKGLGDASDKAKVGLGNVSDAVNTLNKNLSEGLTPLAGYVEQLKQMGQFKTVQPTTPKQTLNINQLQQVVAPPPTAEFKDYVKSLTAGNSELKAMSSYYKDIERSAKARANDEQRAFKEQEKTLKVLERQATITRKAESTTYKGAMGLSENTLSEMKAKIDALKVAQGSLAKGSPELTIANTKINELTKSYKEALTQGVELEKKTNKLAETFNTLARRVAVYASFSILKSTLTDIATIKAEYEVVERSLGAIIGDSRKASEIFKEQQKAALVSPLSVLDLATATKQLSAYGVAVKDLIPTTKVLGDIAAGVGVPLERLVYNTGQIVAKGKLEARDAKDFANAGVNITKALADEYSRLKGRVVSVAEVYNRMSNGMVSANDTMTALTKMTQEGGLFFDMQAKQADTLKGALSNLQDAYANMANEIGGRANGIITAGVKTLRALYENWEAVGAVILNIVATFGVYKTSQMVMNALVGAGNKGLESSILLSKQKEASILRRAKLTRDLTVQEQAFLDTSHKVAVADYRQVLATKTLNKSQLEFLALTNSRNKAMLQAIVRTGELSAAEVRAATSLKGWGRAMTIFGVSVKNAAIAVKGFMVSMLPLLGLSLAIGGITKIITHFTDLSSALKEVNKESSETAKSLAQVGGKMSIAVAGGSFDKQKEALSDLVTLANQTYQTNIEIDWKKLTPKNIVDEFEKIKSELESLGVFINNFNTQWAESSSKLFTDGLGKDLTQFSETSTEQLNALQANLNAIIGLAESNKGVFSAQNTAGLESLKTPKRQDESELDYLTRLRKAYQDLFEWNNKFTEKVKENGVDVKNLFANSGYGKFNFRFDEATKEANDFFESIRSSLMGLSKEAQEEKLQVAIEAQVNKNSLNQATADLLRWSAKQTLGLDIKPIVAPETPTATGATTGGGGGVAKNTELERLKKQIELIKKLQSEYKKLTDTGISNQEAFNRLNKEYGLAVSKYLPEYAKKVGDVAKATAGQTAKILEGLTLAPNKTISKKFKEEYDVELTMNISDYRINSDIDMQKVFNDSLSEALANVQAGFELGIEIESKPGVFQEAFKEMFAINENEIVRNVSDANKKVQDAVNKVLQSKLDSKKKASLLPNISKEERDAFEAEIASIQKTMNEVANFDFVGAKKGSLADLFGGIQIDSETMKAIQKFTEWLEKMRVDSVKRSMNDYEKLYEKYADYEYQRIKIKEETEKKLADLEETYRNKPKTGVYEQAKNNINRAQEEQLGSIKLEEVKNSAEWAQAFGNFEKTSIASLRNVLAVLQDYKEKSAESLSPTDLKTVSDAIDKIESRIEGANPFAQMTAGAKELSDALKVDVEGLLKAKERASAELAQAEAELDAQEEKVKASAKLIQKLKEQGEDVSENDGFTRQSKEYTDAVDKKTKATVKAKEASEDYYTAENNLTKGQKKFIEGLKGSSSVITGIMGDIGKLADVFGSELGDELRGTIDLMNSLVNGYINVVTTMASVAKSAGTGMSFVAIMTATSISTIEKASVILGIISAAIQLATAVASLFVGRKNKEIDREIAKSDLAIKKLNNSTKQLENTHKNLMRAVEKSMGSAEIGAKKVAIEQEKLIAQNAVLHKQELQRKLALEESKDPSGKKGKAEQQNNIAELQGAIIDADQAIIDANNAVKDSIEELVNSLVGSNIKDFAESLASDFIKIRREGGDTAEFLKKSFSDSFDSMIAKAVFSQAIAKEVEKMHAMVQASLFDNYISPEEFKAMQLEGKNMADRSQQTLEALSELYGIGLGSGLSDSLSNFQKGISSLTEQTGGEIEAVAGILKINSYEQINQNNQLIGLSQAQLGVQSNLLLQARESHQLQQTMYNFLDSLTITGASGIGWKSYIVG